MALICPGTSVAVLALGQPAGAAAGVALLDPRFAAILSQSKVSAVHQAALGDAGVDNSDVFGHIARNEDKFYLFMKRVLNLDPDARGEDAVPAARLFMA